MLPPLDKSTIPTAATFLLCMMKGPPGPRPKSSLLVLALAVIFVISPIFTSYVNSYELVIGERSLPGFYLADGLKLALQNLLTIAPFFIGMRVLSTDRGREALLIALVLSGLVYSVGILFELRFSPQLQRLIYGATPAVFTMVVRAGGYRPVMFLSNGLECALFVSMAFVATMTAARLKWRFFSLSSNKCAGYLSVLTLLCKTLGVIVSGAIGALLIIFTKPSTWVRFAAIVASILTAYPLLRTYDLIPVNRISSATTHVSTERSGSFQFRVENENRLLEKANQKPWLGWGTWSRNRVYDPETGLDVTITDGAWILRFGMFGWIGYISLFGLFAVSILRARRGVRGPVTRSTVMLGGLSLILAINLTDLIPNANLTPITFLLAGSVAGRVREKVNSVKIWTDRALGRQKVPEPVLTP